MIPEILVQNIEFFCLQKKTTPKAAGRDSGAGSNFMTNLKKGSVPSVEKVAQLAAYLGVTTSQLLGEESPPGGVAGVSPADQELLAAYHRADKDSRLIVDTALKPFKKEKKSVQAG